MATLNPYLTFGGTARAAMELYQMVLGGDLDVKTFGDVGAEDDTASLVMHAALQTESGFTLFATDRTPQSAGEFGENGNIALTGSESAELKSYWDRFVEAEGTQVVQDLTNTPWGSAFGMLRDPHGVLWLFDIEGGLPQHDPLGEDTADAEVGPAGDDGVPGSPEDLVVEGGPEASRP